MYNAETAVDSPRTTNDVLPHSQSIINRLDGTMNAMAGRLIVLSNLADRLTGCVPSNAQDNKISGDRPPSNLVEHMGMLCDRLDMLTSKLTDETDRLNRFV